MRPWRRVLFLVLIGLFGAFVVTASAVTMSLPPKERVQFLSAVPRLVSMSSQEWMRWLWPELMAKRDFARGAAEARSDIEQGKLYLRVYGLRPYKFDQQWSRELELLGVELDYVAGCIVDSALESKTAGYNSVIAAEIADRYGDNALEDAGERARRIADANQ